MLDIDFGTYPYVTSRYVFCPIVLLLLLFRLYYVVHLVDGASCAPAFPASFISTKCPHPPRGNDDDHLALSI